MDTDTITRFGQALRGALVGRQHPQYEEVRQLYDGAIDKHPLFIARCLDTADVVIAVNFGRDNRLPIAICEFQSIPATYSDLIAATLPI